MGIEHWRREGICMGVMRCLPWWACVALAAFTYVALHSLALRPRTIIVESGAIYSAVAGFLVGGLMESLQYLLPAVWICPLLARLARLPAEAVGPGGRGAAANPPPPRSPA